LKAQPEVLTLPLEGRDVRIHLIRGRGRSVRLSITSRGEVRLHAPGRVSAAQALDFAREKSRWIEKTLRKIESYTRLTAPANPGPPGTVAYLGEDIPVVPVKGTRPSAGLRDGRLVVRVSDPADDAQIRRRIDAWLKEWAVEVFSRILQRSMESAAPQGIPEPEWTVRFMKRRWGSCSRTGRIVFNVRLVQTPVALIEYVVMHELCHLKHHDHGRAFYALLGRCLPDWKERRKRLGRIVVD
jgi:hypothetical protein